MTNTTQQFKIGDTVQLAPEWAGKHLGIVYIVESLPKGARGVNYILAPQDNPEGRKMRAPGDILIPVTGTPVVRPVAEKAAMSEMPGTVVETHGLRGIEDGTLMVVLDVARKGDTFSKTALLGGNGGRYWPALPAKNLRKVDIHARLS